MKFRHKVCKNIRYRMKSCSRPVIHEYGEQNNHQNLRLNEISVAARNRQQIETNSTHLMFLCCHVKVTGGKKMEIFRLKYMQWWHYGKFTQTQDGTWQHVDINLFRFAPFGPTHPVSMNWFFSMKKLCKKEGKGTTDHLQITLLTTFTRFSIELSISFITFTQEDP